MTRFAVLAALTVFFSCAHAFFLNLPGLNLPGAGCNCAPQLPVCPPQPQCAPVPPPAPCAVHPSCSAPPPPPPLPVVANNFGAFNNYNVANHGYVQPQPQQPLLHSLPQEAAPAIPAKNHEFSSGPGPASVQKVNYEAAKVQHKEANEEYADEDIEVDPEGNVDSHASSSFEAQHAPINPQTKKATKREAKEALDVECNSEALRKIILENTKESPADSKRAIQKAAREEVGGRMDVICSKGKFSYIVNSQFYCEGSHGGITCLVFRQASD